MSTPSIALDPSNINQGSLSSATRSAGNFCGRVFKKIVKGFTDAGEGVLKGVKKVMIALGHIRSDRNAFANAIGLGVNAFSAIELGIGKPGILQKFTSRFLMTNSIIDQFQVLDSIGYFGARKWRANPEAGKDKPDSKLTIAGQACFFAASAGGLALFLGKVTLLSLSKISAAIGSLPVFGMVTRLGIGFGTMVTGVVGVGFAFFGANAIRKLANKEIKGHERSQAKWDLAWCASEVALKSYIVAGSIIGGGFLNPIALLVLGSTAAGLGIASVLHSKKEKKD